MPKTHKNRATRDPPFFQLHKRRVIVVVPYLYIAGCILKKQQGLSYKTSSDLSHNNTWENSHLCGPDDDFILIMFKPTAILNMLPNSDSIKKHQNVAECLLSFIFFIFFGFFPPLLVKYIYIGGLGVHRPRPDSKPVLVI